MSYTIKASWIKPGMVIEWMDRDTFTRIPVERYYPLTSTIRSVGGTVRHLSPDTEVAVVSSSPLIPEPTTLGARVEAGTNLFLRVSNHECAWLDVTGGVNDLYYTWKEVNEFGPVTIIDGNPSWDTGTTGDDDSDQWDDIETALKHCDRVIDKNGSPWYYLDGDLHFTFFGKSAPWVLNIGDVNRYGPFRRS